MKKGTMIYLPVVLYKILSKHTDSEHRLSMPEILSLLEEEGYPAGRRSVYKAIDVLKENGVNIVFDKTGGMQGYRMDHLFTTAESLYLINAVQNSYSLTEDTADAFTAKIRSLVSDHEAELLSAVRTDVIHTDNRHVMDHIQLLLSAIRDCRFVDFRYYDISVTRQKKYRRNSEHYHLVPYAVVTDAGRYYCVFWSPVHQNFANYRIDKMDHVTLSKDLADPVPFSLDDHMRAAFSMYHGEASTVTAEFDLSLSSQVFDRFGSDIIISKVTDTAFTASIRTAVTPPLVSWILQYPEKITVKKPQELIDRLKEIAEILQNTYRKGK